MNIPANLSDTSYQFKYRVIGEGHPIIIFNGIAMMSDVWDPLIAFLKDKYKVITFDFPNQNGHVDLSYDRYEQYLEYARAFVHFMQEGDTRPHAIGLSFGAEIIRDLMLSGEKLGRCILCGVSPDRHQIFWKQYFRAQHQVVEQSGPTGLARFMAFNIFSSQAINSNHRLVDALTFSLRLTYEKNIPALSTIVRIPLTSPLIDEMPRRALPCKTLILHGELDNLIPVRKIEEYAHHVGATFKSIAHAGHMFTIERSEKAFKLIRHFLDLND